MEATTPKLACIVCICGLNVVGAGVEEGGVIGVGCRYRLQAGVDGCRFLLCNMQPVGRAQSSGVDFIHNGIVENEGAGKVVHVVVSGCGSFVVVVVVWSGQVLSTCSWYPVTKYYLPQGRVVGD